MARKAFVTRSSFDNFEQIFYRLLEEKTHCVLTKRTWETENQKKRTQIEKELAEREAEIVDGPSLYFGGVDDYFTYLEVFYIKRTNLQKIFHYYWDEGEAMTEDKLVRQFEYFDVVQLEKPSVFYPDTYQSEQVKGFLKAMAAVFNRAIDIFRIDEHRPETRKREGPGREEQPIAQFPSPPGLRWEDVSIAFISDNDIRVEAKGLATQYSYDEIGFDDKRDGGKGNLWFVFRALAMLKGSATVDNLANASKDKNNVSKDISRLRKILFKLMGIKGDPFHNYKNYKKHQYYQTKFKLRDEKYGGVLKKD